MHPGDRSCYLRGYTHHAPAVYSSNTAYATYFPDPKPTRTTVGSQLLGILVEIDAIAYVAKE
jgi:enamine deaminase RidA (YjgF/YER057c/UK114 family)